MKGIAITLAAPADGDQVAAIEKLTGTRIVRVGAVQDAAVPVGADTDREPGETREREPRRGRRDRKPRPPRSEAREAEAPQPAPKEERNPRPERRPPEPKTDQAEESDDGWNGPMPSFLSIRAD